MRPDSPSGGNLSAALTPRVGTVKGAALPNDLPELLTEITPEGAPALAVEPPGSPFVFAPFPLPLTTPHEPIHGQWLSELLVRVQVQGRPLEPEAARMLARMLGGPQRPDGLPGWHPREARVRSRRTGAWVAGWAWPSEADHARARAEGASPVITDSGTVSVKTFTVTSTTRQRGDRSWGRAVWAAAAADLAGASMTDVSRMLELNEHEQPDHGGRRLRGAERHRAKGRELLAAIGAWPWAHAETGRLKQTWRSDRLFIDPLRDWQERACVEIAAKLERCRSVAAESLASPPGA